MKTNIKGQKLGDKLNLLSEEISSQRKELLSEVAEKLGNTFSRSQSLKIIFICTHNSRRSHIAQFMLEMACGYYSIQGIEIYSGGTEVTALNKRVVHAISSHGIKYDKTTGDDNPTYIFDHIEGSETPYFSKLYNHPANPTSNFTAILVCDHASETCPYIPGTLERIHLHYRDPKEYDRTPGEEKAYMDKLEEIGAEMFYIARQLKGKVIA